MYDRVTFLLSCPLLLELSMDMIVSDGPCSQKKIDAKINSVVAQGVRIMSTRYGVMN